MNELNNADKKNIFGKMKESFSGRKFRSGFYVTVVSMIVIVIVLVVNMLISQMNIQFDLSTQGMFTLTKESKDMIKALKDDITIYYMVEAGNEKDVYQKIAEQYDTLSDHISLESKDPVLYPAFAKEHNIEEVVDQDSFIVVNNTNGRAKYIPSSDLLEQTMDYQTYQTQVTGIDVEGQLSSAIQYVTMEELPLIYLVSGHGEEEVGKAFGESMEKMNVTTKKLQTATISEIPEDCDILFINAPDTDFKEEEVTMIKDYLAAGGNVIITLDAMAGKLSNLESIINYYGIDVVNGLVVEGDTNHHASNYPHFLVPTIDNHVITKSASKSRILVFMPYSLGLKEAETKRSSLKLEPLLFTTNSAYAKGEGNEAITKEEGDIEGPFNLGMLSSDTYNGVTSNLVVYSSGLMFSDDMAGYANMNILSGTVGYMEGDQAPLSIPSKSTAAARIQITQQKAIFWGGVVVIFLPVAILVTGIVVSVRRRKK